VRIAILAEQDFGLVDGSTIWTLNLCRMLTKIPSLRVVLVLRQQISSRVLADELPVEIDLLSPTDLGLGQCLTPNSVAAAVLAAEARGGPFDRILVRGDSFLRALLASESLTGKVVAYSTSVSVRLGNRPPDWIELARNARRPVMTQSAAAKVVFETFHNYPASLVRVLPPVANIPDGLILPVKRPLSLVYGGKIDPEYGLGWLCDLCEIPDEIRGIKISIVAGKVMAKAGSPEIARFERLAAAPKAGINLRVGLGHTAALREMSLARFGFCLRSPVYDDVMEVSTKVLEFCALGVAPLLNDTALNRELMGDDYPFYFRPSQAGLALDLLERLKSATDAHMEIARRRMAEAKTAFSPEAALSVLRKTFDLGLTSSGRGRPLTLRIATHDDKFLGGFVDRISSDPTICMKREDWTGIGKRPALPALANEGETIFCEWCGENAVWHSHNKPKGARLIIRLHRVEAYRDFPARVNWNAVDRLIVVSEHFKKLMVDVYGVPSWKIEVLPQYVDCEGLNRKKRPGARFAIGFVGLVPFAHKRFDRAVDFLAAIRAVDPRFSMIVRGAMPWKLRWAWEDRPDEKQAYERVFERVFSDPELAAAIRFDPPGADMEEWFRDVGFILSTSDSEGCHTAIMEGLASGAMPIVRAWPGAAGLFGDYVHAEAEAAIPKVISHATALDWEDRCRHLSAHAQKWDVNLFNRKMVELVA